jgi:hypothetical protein
MVLFQKKKSATYEVAMNIQVLNLMSPDKLKLKTNVKS